MRHDAEHAERESDPCPLTRRRVIGLIGALPLIAAPARAQESQEFPLKGDDGAPIQNFRIPAELDPATLPGVVWTGGPSADVILYEFFDYNCGFCRKATREIEAIVAQDRGLRLGLVNNPILSLGSVQAAKVQQGVLKLRGPQAAYDFHLRMFAKRGQSDGPSALAIAKSMGLDVQKIEAAADSETVSQVLSRQARLASSLGMAMTPSFAIAGVGLLGWPGVEALRSIVSNVRKCDHPVCGGKG